ncbi:MAG: hypothetical protein IKK96_04205 [Lachnospiraceae bacterium]|nr:hypothetical protein [Lachnospiraceae bacterium]
MSKTFKRIAAVLIMLVLVGLVPFSSGDNTVYAAKDKDFNVEVQCGYNNSIQVRCYVPFYITIENNGENFDGSVQVITPKNEYNVMYEKDVSLARGTKKTVTLTVPIMNYTDKVNVRIVNRKDKVVWSENVKCNVLYSLTDVNIGVLIDDFTALSYMSGQPLFSYSSLATKIYELDENTMPEEWMALQMLDAIVVTNFSTDKLSETQINALGTWVEEGGLLILGTGSTANKTLSALNGNIVDVKTGDLKSYSTKFGYTLINYMSDTFVDGSINYKYFQISDVAVDTISKLIEEYMDANLDTHNIAGMSYDYDMMFSEFYELNKDSIEQVCKTEFLKSYYGVASMPVEEWNNYGENEFRYTLSQMFEMKFTAVREQKIMELMSQTAGSITFVDADVLELEVKRDGGSYTMFYGETAQNDRLFPLVTSVARGKGYIAVAGIDFTQNPFCTFKGNSTVFVNVIKNLIGQKVLKEANEYTVDYYYDNNYDYNIRNTVEMSASASAPPVLLYVLIIGAYLVLCLVVFFILKKKKKNMLLWVVQSVMAVAFAFIIYLVGFTTRIVKPELNVVALTQVEGNYESVTSYATVTMPKNKNYKVKFSNRYSMELASLERNYYYGNSQNKNLDSYYLGIHNGLDFTEVELCNRQSLATESFKLNKSEYIEGGFVMNLSESSNGELRGTVTNNYGKKIENAFIYYNQKMFVLGDMADGATVEITGDTPSFYSDRYYHYYNGMEEGERLVFGDENNALKVTLFGDSTREGKREQMKRVFLDYARERLIRDMDYMGNYYYNNYYPGAILFGFPSDSENRSVQSDDGMQENIFEMVYTKYGAQNIEGSTVMEEIKDVDIYEYKYYIN